MMKNIWVKAIPWKPELIQAAVESGADAVWVEPGRSAEAKRIGLIKTIAEDGDIKPGRDVEEKEIREKSDEEEIVALSLSRKVVVRTGDWKIIPLENLISRTKNIFVEVSELWEGHTALAILEKGVDGVVVNHPDPSFVRHLVRSLKARCETLELVTARVTAVEPLGLGDRVCVDTCTAMAAGEGMLVGNSSQALFLVHSETMENPFIETRPFRVNAGPIHAYIRIEGGRTKYLSEVRAGDEVLIVNYEGKSYPAVVGRAKVERRPLALIRAEMDGRNVSVILQNAETIRLVEPSGKPVSLTDLKKGSEVLVYQEKWGRHSGIPVDETIIER